MSTRSLAAGDDESVRVAEMQKTFRDLWLGHIYMIQHVVLDSTTNNQAERIPSISRFCRTPNRLRIHLCRFTVKPGLRNS